MKKINWKKFWDDKANEDFVTSSGKTSLRKQDFFLYIFYINYSSRTKYNPENSNSLKSNLKETISSLIFAIIAATIVHNYIISSL